MKKCKVHRGASPINGNCQHDYNRTVEEKVQKWESSESIITKNRNYLDPLVDFCSQNDNIMICLGRDLQLLRPSMGQKNISNHKKGEK